MDKIKGYTLKEVAALLYIRPQTVSFYTNEGLIVPEIDNPKGKGTTRKYSKINILEILLIKELSNHGLPLQKIKDITFQFRMRKFIKEGYKRFDPTIDSIEDEDEQLKRKLTYELEYMRKNKESWGSSLFQSEFLDRNQLLVVITYTPDGYPDVFIGSRNIIDKDKPIELQTLEAKSNDYKDVFLINGFYSETVIIIDITELFKRVSKM